MTPWSEEHALSPSGQERTVQLTSMAQICRSFEFDIRCRHKASVSRQSSSVDELLLCRFFLCSLKDGPSLQNPLICLEYSNRSSMMVDKKFVARYLRSRNYPRAAEHRERARQELSRFPADARESEERESFLDRTMGNPWLTHEMRWQGSLAGLAWHLNN